MTRREHIDHDYEYSDTPKAHDIEPSLNGFSVDHDAIKYRMLSPSNPHGITFTDVMTRFERRNADVMLFTMDSAIPLADAVRGWQQVTGKPAPELAPIFASRTLSIPTSDIMYTSPTVVSLKNRVLNWQQTFDTQFIDKAEVEQGNIPAEELQEMLTLAEVARLKQRYMGRTAVIFDQYTATGSTLRLAVDMARKADVQVSDASFDAKWYHQYTQKNIRDDDTRRQNLAEMTSTYSNFMHNIGSRAAQDYLRQH